jgi:LuxR family transcriptional regulator, maltose regulon positive regulatory protein
MADTNIVLIESKIHKPRITRKLVLRPRLFEKLNRGLNGNLILVSAAAGFGKTMLIRSWLEDLSRDDRSVASFPTAWLTLDDIDSDLFVFLKYFIASIRSIFPDACRKSFDLTQAHQNPPIERMSSTLSNEIGVIKDDFILVLDDYHLIQGESVNKLIADLLTCSLENLHLVILSRKNPPLPLAALRAIGLVTEIRSRDLRFTRDELESFFNLTLSVRLSETDLNLLENKTEGWVAAMHLYQLAVSNSISVRQSLNVLSISDANVSDYLTSEVLSRQLPAIHNFLLKTSILDRFSLPFCEAVIGTADPAWRTGDCLARIVKDDLFISSFGQKEEWFSYHHLFRELLRRKLAEEYSSAEIKEIHRSAAEWLIGNGYIEDALHHALSAKDIELTTRAVEVGLRDALNREDRLSLEQWQRLIPDDYFQQSPGLLMLKAWIALFEWQLDVISNVIEQAETLLSDVSDDNPSDEHVRIIKGQILTLRVQEAYFKNQPAQALALSRSAMEVIPHSWTYTRSAVFMYTGMSMFATGQGEQALQYLSNNFLDQGSGYEHFTLRRFMSLSFIHLNNGMLDQAQAVSDLLLTRAILSNLPVHIGWGHLLQGTVAYLKNDLVAAELHFKEIVDRRYISQLLSVRDGFTGLALVYQAKGMAAEAFHMVDALIQIDLEQKGIESDQTCSLRARFWYLNFDMVKASRWADSFTKNPQPQPLIWLEDPYLTKALILTSRGKEQEIKKAIRILDKLEVNAHKTCNTYYLVRILAQRALALSALGKNRDSQKDLRQALKLAEPGGMIRIFIDLGPTMGILLRRLTPKGVLDGFIQKILDAFPKDNFLGVKESSKIQMPQGEAPSRFELDRPLTSRELELLTLLREPISNKQIADRLSLSYATVKRYSINLYEKLGVNNRWDAVSRGIEKGILPLK